MPNAVSWSRHFERVRGLEEVRQRFGADVAEYFGGTGMIDLTLQGGEQIAIEFFPEVCSLPGCPLST